MFNFSAQSSVVSRVENAKGEAVYVAPRSSGNQTQFRILMRRSGQSWIPVTNLSSSVDRFSFQTNYAFLPSQLDAQGTPLALQNSANPGAIETPGLSYNSEDNSYMAGEELEVQDDGRLVLHSRCVRFPVGHKPSGSERSEILEYHYDDTRWTVNL